MKRIKFWFLILIPFVFSCSEEELQLNDEILDTEGVIARITSDISGSSCGSPGGILTLTYSADFNPNDVNWSIQSGNISIIGGQGTNRLLCDLRQTSMEVQCLQSAQQVMEVLYIVTHIQYPNVHPKVDLEIDLNVHPQLQ